MPKKQFLPVIMVIAANCDTMPYVGDLFPTRPQSYQVILVEESSPTQLVPLTELSWMLVQKTLGTLAKGIYLSDAKTHHRTTAGTILPVRLRCSGFRCMQAIRASRHPP